MAIYYVRKTGLDSNLGTSKDAALLTINKALDICSAGDTIYVGAGTYSDTIQYVTKANITLIGDTTGDNTGDKGLIIISQTTIHQFVWCTGTNFTVKNIISSTSNYSLYLNNDTSKFINCIFCGINGGGSSGISYSGYLYNCVAIGNYALASNVGAPIKVVNSILIGTNEVGTTNFQNCYTLAAGSDIFIDKANNNYRVKVDYYDFVKNKGVVITDVPTKDIVGNSRQTPPWIGAYDSEVINKFLLKKDSNYYSIKPEYYDESTHSFTPLTLVGGTDPSGTDINNFGFDNLLSFISPMTKGSDTFKPCDKLKNCEIKCYTKK